MPEEYKNFITKKGYQLLKNKWLLSKKEKLERLQREINQARNYCDFGEDVTFQSLINERFRLEEEISNVENLLTKVTIIDAKQRSTEKISFGHTVTLINITNGTKETFTIGHSMEGNVRNNLLSVYSPLGKKLLGKRVGDLILLNFLDQTIKRKIIHIE